MMTKILQICLLVSLVFVATNTKAQDVTAKDILAQAAEATLDKENIATARGTGIQGRYTAVKMSKGQDEDLRSGFYAGILELKVSGDYGNLKSGKFNLFFKESNEEGLKLYLEEKGSISNIFGVTQTAPENYKDTTNNGKPELAFLEPLSNGKDSMSFSQIFSSSIYSFASYTAPVKPAMWVKVCGKTCRWVRVY